MVCNDFSQLNVWLWEGNTYNYFKLKRNHLFNFDILIGNIFEKAKCKDFIFYFENVIVNYIMLYITNTQLGKLYIHICFVEYINDSLTLYDLYNAILYTI